MDSREFINHIIELERELRRFQYDILEMDSALYGVCSPCIKPDSVQSSHTNDGLCIRVCATEEKREAFKKLYDELRSARKKFVEIVGHMPHEVYRLILIHRYCDGKSLAEIADAYDMNHATVRKYHGRGLKEFDKMYIQFGKF